MQQRTLNLGILAHVDAGKTTLTERLLYAAGVIDAVGSVDQGSTRTDYLALERQRGITIRSAVVSFEIDDVKINLIDTPGHPDFIAEVERVLNVLDGAVLVISAVEGVQPQTRILMRALQRLRVPTLIFVNKIDRRGARYTELVQAISDKLTPAVLTMGSVEQLGSRQARVNPWGQDDEQFRSALAALVSERNDALLASFVRDEEISYGRLRKELEKQTQRAITHPVFFGSALTGAGIDGLMRGIAALLPATSGDGEGEVSGKVFKIERGPSGDKIAYVRMFCGTAQVRDRVALARGDEAKITAIDVFERGDAVRRQRVSAGHIAKMWGLGRAQVGDPVGAARAGVDHHFAPPTLETVVMPLHRKEKGALRAALAQLAEQDPLIDVRQDGSGGEISLSLYGEVQKEVIGATLANDFGLEVRFRETTTICIERPAGAGSAVELLGRDQNPFLATLGLRVEPAPEGTGVHVQVEAKVEDIPLYVFKRIDDFRGTMEETVRETLQQGLCGWEVLDCTVTVTRSGYSAPATAARDFRLLTPLVLMDALKEAGTTVHEPIHRFELEFPADSLATVMPLLGRLKAVPGPPVMRGPMCILIGHIAAARVHALRQRLAAATHGEGVVESSFARYEPVRGAAPSRPRTDNNPLNRDEYLLHLSRRIGSASKDGSEGSPSESGLKAR